jgi:hypothetical protein
MDNFSGIRNYLLKKMDYMISDSTGILPEHANAAGFKQLTFGKFNGAFLKDNGGILADKMRRLWVSQPHRPLDFRFGYSDIKGASHLMITFLVK